MRAVLLLLVVPLLPACTTGSSAVSGAPLGVHPFPPPRRYRCVRADAAPEIDGRLDDAAWDGAEWSLDYVDITGAEELRPPLRTRMKLVWDDEHLYVAAEMEEPHLWGTLTERDSVIFHDNDFEVFIDPDGDTHTYYELEINALGTVFDLFLAKPYREGGPVLHAWDVRGLKSAVHLDGTLNDPSDEDRGWAVEIAIPWKALHEAAGTRTPPASGDRWRMNFSRVQWDLEVVDGAYRKVARPSEVKHPEHNWVWSAQGEIDMHRPETWGIVQFADAPRTYRSKGGTILLPEETQAPHRAEEAARVRLYLVYHAQRAWRAAHGRWADDAAVLDLPAVEPFGEWSWPPVIETTAFGYDAWIDGPDRTRLHLREDGRIRRVSRD